MFGEEVRSFDQTFSFRVKNIFQICSVLTSIVDHLVVCELCIPLVFLRVQPKNPGFLDSSLIEKNCTSITICVEFELKSKVVRQNTNANRIVRVHAIFNFG